MLTYTFYVLAVCNWSGLQCRLW